MSGTWAELNPISPFANCLCCRPRSLPPRTPSVVSRVGAKVLSIERWHLCSVPSSIRRLTVVRIGTLSSSSPEHGKFCIVLLNTQCEEVPMK